MAQSRFDVQAKKFTCLKAATCPGVLDIDDSENTASLNLRVKKDTEDHRIYPPSLVVSIDDSSGSEDGDRCNKRGSKTSGLQNQRDCVSPNAAVHDSIVSGVEQTASEALVQKAERSFECSGQVAVGSTALSWTVVKPSMGTATCALPKTHPRKPPKQSGKGQKHSQHQQLKGTAESSNQQDVAVLARFRDRATSLLSETLGSDERGKEVSATIVNAFLKVHDVALARRLLLDLGSALRRNSHLQSEILAAGPAYAANLAQQDPREWATHELQAKRQRWTEESLHEIKPSAPAAICPVCGGRAVIATGTAGSGRSGRLTKAFAHYSCLEESCGKSSHVKQD